MRFNVIFCIAFSFFACSNKRDSPLRSSRYEAVKPSKASHSNWCDHTFSQTPVHLSLPPTVVVQPGLPSPQLAKNKSVWINLWASWCQPCLREMPLIMAWQKDLRKDGVDVDVWFLSVDDEPDVLAKFLTQHQEIPVQQVLRVASLEHYQTWIEAYGSNPAAAIPIHLMAGADGKVRCLRTGVLREGDYPTVRALFR